MDTLGLSLRQKKILHLLRGMSSYITGAELGKQLGVSSRTIRSDIAGINDALAPYNARICSEHSKGYLYQAEDPEAIQSMNRIDNAFFTRDERVRYLAFRFCLADDPLNIYDLEDEIFVSHTTLEHDIRHLKMKYVLSGPRIRFIQEKDSLSFEKDERKRRAILNHLFHADWDYHARSNAYYSYHFLDMEQMDRILDLIPPALQRHGIVMEDPALVSLNLAVAIMIHRAGSGHPIPPCPARIAPEEAVQEASRDLFSVLLQEFGVEFSEAEQREIERMIDETRMMDVSDVHMGNVQSCFHESAIRLATEYLEKIHTLYGVDFSQDEDFYITLLSYIQFLQTSERIFNDQENTEILRENLLFEFEIAWAIQDLAAVHLGYYFTETEILYLAHAISGALEFFFETHPEYKLRTVICCHLNMTAAWALKRRVLGAFDKYLNIAALLPVNSKSSFDFKNVDLVLSTVRKTITKNPGTDTIQIGTLFPPDDYLTISAYIYNYRLRHLCPSGTFSMKALLEDAIWIENMEADTRFDVIEAMAETLISAGIVPPEYEADLLRREAISSFSIRQDILFLHSLVPALRTKLCVAVFSRKMSWQSNKIRAVFMGAFTPEDTAVMLRLNQILNSSSLDPGNGKGIPTRADIMAAMCNL